MNTSSAVTIKSLDQALVTVSKYVDGKISLKDLEESVSFESADLLTRLGLANLKGSYMDPVSFRPKFLEPPTITVVGRSRLARLAQTELPSS